MNHTKTRLTKTNKEIVAYLDRSFTFNAFGLINFNLMSLVTGYKGNKPEFKRLVKKLIGETIEFTSNR